MHDFLYTFINLIDHIVPIFITTMIFVIIWALRTYLPQLHYIDLITKATNDTGIIKLAKYMAKQNGGKHIDTDEFWEAFVPAARAVSAEYRKNH